VFFKNMYPISLSQLDFNVNDTDLTYLTADVTFVYQNYTIETI